MLKQSNYLNHYHQMMNNSSHQHTQQLLNNQVKLSLNNVNNNYNNNNEMNLSKNSCKNYRIINQKTMFNCTNNINSNISSSSSSSSSPIFMKIKYPQLANHHNASTKQVQKTGNNYVIKYPVSSNQTSNHSSSSISSGCSSFIHSPIKANIKNDVHNTSNLYDEIQYYECIPIRIVNNNKQATTNENNKFRINCFTNKSFAHHQPSAAAAAPPPPVPSSSIPTSSSSNKTCYKSTCYNGGVNSSQYDNSHYYHSYSTKKPIVSNSSLDKLTNSISKLKLKPSKIITNLNVKKPIRSSPLTLCSSGYDSSQDLSSSSVSSSSSNNSATKNPTTIISYCSINHDYESKQKYLDSLKHKQLNQLIVQQKQNLDLSTSSFLSTKSILNTNNKSKNKSQADSGIFTLSNITNLSDSIADATSNISSINDNTSLLSSPYHLSTSISSCSSIKSAELDADDEDNNLDSLSSDIDNIQVEASPFPKVKTCLIAQIKQINNNNNNTSSSNSSLNINNTKKRLSNPSSDSFYENLSDTFNKTNNNNNNIIINNNNSNNNSIKKNYSINDVLHSLKSLESFTSSNNKINKNNNNNSNRYDYQDDDYLCDREVEFILNRPSNEEYEMYHQHQQFNQIKNQPIKQYYNLSQHLKQLTTKKSNTNINISNNNSKNNNNNNNMTSSKSFYLQPFWEQLV